MKKDVAHGQEDDSFKRRWDHYPIWLWPMLGVQNQRDHIVDYNLKSRRQVPTSKLKKKLNLC